MCHNDGVNGLAPSRPNAKHCPEIKNILWYVCRTKELKHFLLSVICSK